MFLHSSIEVNAEVDKDNSTKLYILNWKIKPTRNLGKYLATSDNPIFQHSEAKNLS